MGNFQASLKARKLRSASRAVGFGVLLFGAASVSSAISLNIDLDVGFGPPEGGNGAPSSGFSGAAPGQAGFWNRIDASGPSVPTMLRTLTGEVSSARILATGGIGVSGGSGYTGNTGDFNLLLNDYARIGGASGQVEYHFSGILPGRYLIYTFAVEATGRRVNAEVTVPGAIDPTMIVTGPMPGNQLILGVTHSSHDLTITGDSFEIRVRGPWPHTECNGFQIVAVVPEPASILCFLCGGALFALMKSRHRR